jgi:hypothetical protein
MLSKDGIANTVSECFFTAPANRAITSIGSACQGLNIDNNQFLSNEQGLEVAERVTIGFNVNSNDAKIRNNRAVRFKHFCILSGAGYIISGNHWFQADGQGTSTRTAGIILADNYAKTTITGNYVDNSFIEWSNEHNPTPDGNGFSFSGMTIGNNFFTVKNVDPWFRWLKIRPYNDDHFINGFNMSGNVFKVLGSQIDRVEEVDTTFSILDEAKTQEFTMVNNSFTNVNYPAANPVRAVVSSSNTSTQWTADFSDKLPFGLRAMNVSSVCAKGAILTGAGASHYSMPYTQSEQGSGNSEISLNWSTAVKGEVVCIVHAETIDEV